MSNLSQSFDSLFGKLENFVTTKTVVGEAIVMGDVIILPMVDVSFGVGAGAGEGKDKDGQGAGLGGGFSGAKLTPSAVLVINGGNVQLVSVKDQDSLSKIIDLAPGVINKISSMFGKGESGECCEEEE
ncbi:MAG: sporulation protein [Defluviitaleaceae bacterium]|nr:sporulation protein [Defluviitaleaceae bacterium]